jgi:hypothetical protein
VTLKVTPKVTLKVTPKVTLKEDHYLLQ